MNRENKTGGVPGGVATGLVAVGQQIPVIVKRCVEEVERRGLDIIGTALGYGMIILLLIILCFRSL